MLAGLRTIVVIALMFSASVARAEPPVVFAAASLKGSLDEIAQLYATQNGRDTPILSFASSAALARQIEQGAPADVFISASGEWMDYLEERRLIAGETRQDLLSNRLVLIASGQGADRRLVTLEDFAALEPNTLIATGLVDSVPAGIYAQQSLRALGVWPMLFPARLAQADNVRAALTLVVRGDVERGIVYQSDARSSERVRVVGTFDAGTHDPIRYPVARVSGSSNAKAQATEDFLRFLTSEPALEVFLAAGFERP